MAKLQMLGQRVKTAPGRLSQASGAAGPERIRGSALQKIRHRIMTRDQGLCRCLLCQREKALRAAHEVEHLVPLWAGGKEDDANRYAINRECHAEKTRCEERMRAAGGYEPGACTCGRHPTL